MYSQYSLDPVERDFIRSDESVNSLYDSLKKEFPFIEKTEKAQLEAYSRNIESCRRWRSQHKHKKHKLYA